MRRDTAFLDDIADELAVTKGAFYYNVKDKDDLLHQCFERSLALMTATQERASMRGGTGLEELQRCVTELFEVQAGGLTECSTEFERATVLQQHIDIGADWTASDGYPIVSEP